MWAQHPLRAEILCPEKYPLGWVNMHLYKFLVCGPKFTWFLLSNVGGVVVVQLRVRSVPGIFAIKVESCQKSCRNLDVFLALPNFLGAGHPKVVHALSPLPRVTSSGKVSINQSKFICRNNNDINIYMTIINSGRLPEKPNGSMNWLPNTN